MNGVKRNRQKLSDTASLAFPSVETLEELPVFVPAPNDRAHLLILLLALISGACLMLPMLNNVPLAMDDYGTYWIISDSNPLTLMERSLKYENIPPLSPLVRRFVQLVGIYPAGNLVKLTTGEIAVVRKIYAPDPYRPQVRVLINASGQRLDIPYELNLWETSPDRKSAAIVAPLDPAKFNFDPLMLM